MKRAEVLITQLVTSRALAVIDEYGNLAEVQEIYEEEGREDTHLEAILEYVDEEGELPDHREVEKY